MTPFPRCDTTTAWAALRGHFEAHGRELDLRDAFARDPARFERFSVEAPEVFCDLSKNLLDAATVHFLADLARECGVEAQRDAMLAGEAINVTEDGRCCTPPLRAPPGTRGIRARCTRLLDAMLAFADAVRCARDAGELRHFVNIGIGGSELGPQMAVAALAGSRTRSSHATSLEVDGHDIASCCGASTTAETLFVVDPARPSRPRKTWPTRRRRSLVPRRRRRRDRRTRLRNPQNARPCALRRDPVPSASGTGSAPLPLWSAIGLPIAIAIGAAGFRELLAGAHAMDAHFAHTPVEKNLPMLLGLVDVWYRNFHGFTSRSVAPYHHGLKRLPAYLQQLEMESNGKRVDREGRELAYATGPVVWGEPGTNGQHAYFQMLHQGKGTNTGRLSSFARPTRASASAAPVGAGARASAG